MPAIIAGVYVMQTRRTQQIDDWRCSLPLAEYWYRIFKKLQKRFQWTNNSSLNDEIKRYHVVLETAKAGSTRHQALASIELQKQKYVVSQQLLQLLSKERLSSTTKVKNRWMGTP